MLNVLFELNSPIKWEVNVIYFSLAFGQYYTCNLHLTTVIDDENSTCVRPF